MKTRVNKDICIGCGACTAIASNVFQIGDDGFAEAINPNDEKEKTIEINDSEKENVLDAADSCPVGAIEVID